MTTEKPRAYLGDGLYAEYDGFQIRLYAPRPNGTHEIFLEPSTLQALLNFVGTHVGAIVKHPK